jgi:hypothetical protein
VEHVDCEECGYERDVCGCCEPDGSGDECVYADVECRVSDADGGESEVVDGGQGIMRYRWVGT